VKALLAAKSKTIICPMYLRKTSEGFEYREEAAFLVKVKIKREKIKTIFKKVTKRFKRESHYKDIKPFIYVSDFSPEKKI